MDKFVTKLIVNVVILNRSDKNINKLLLLDLNVNNFFLDQNVNKLSLLDHNVSNFLIISKSQYFFLFYVNVSNFLLDIKITLFD